MQNENNTIDHDLVETSQDFIDKRLFTQIRIYWLVICLVVSLPAIYSFLMDRYDGMTLIYQLLPLFFLYTIVIQKKEKFITWGLLFSGIVTLLSLVGLGMLIYNGYFSDNDFARATANPIIIVIQAAIAIFMIWGVILHVKYKVE